MLANLLASAVVREERPGEYLVEGAIDPATIAHVAAWLAERGDLLSELRVGRQSLEEVFLHLTADNAPARTSEDSQAAGQMGHHA